ncbi:MAG: hypothetical protein ABR579_06190, partial [Actinomycetota bacterium]
MRGINRRRVELALAFSAMVGLSACAPPKGGNPEPAKPPVPLVVSNRSDFEVVVYAVPSAGSNGIRLGNARSFATTTMSIPRNAMRGSDVLILRLHAIGGSSRMNWTSPAASIDNDVTAQLDIRIDATGNMNKSALYTEQGSL